MGDDHPGVGAAAQGWQQELRWQQELKTTPTQQSPGRRHHVEQAVAAHAHVLQVGSVKSVGQMGNIGAQKSTS